MADDEEVIRIVLEDGEGNRFVHEGRPIGSSSKGSGGGGSGSTGGGGSVTPPPIIPGIGGGGGAAAGGGAAGGAAGGGGIPPINPIAGGAGGIGGIASLAVPLALATSAIYLLKASIDAMTEHAEKLLESVRGLSPDVAVADAQAKIRDLQVRIDRAERLGGQLAEFRDSSSRIDAALDRIDTSIGVGIMPVLNTIKGFVADVLEIIAEFSEYITGGEDPANREKAANRVRDQVYAAINDSRFVEKLDKLQTLEDIQRFLTKRFQVRTHTNDIRAEIAEFLTPRGDGGAGQRIERPDLPRGIF